ncbi:hypothetical protein O7602_14585 [Micromonospora sp. WMMD1128]|uniref:hypothetical protein n=1 Tax=Micromonospora sp. WMMD1128 TaxID=3015150 RepID=UPI00248C4CAE|nr:hypothetical protein [Micromonospora sp. WMMD1128]WBB76681.1 hypothetical protein O7602_14585 [Micromonospora sp. WMMD1128]
MDGRLHAVWTGRFQPPHIGHLAVLRRSLAALPLPHVAVLTTHFGWRSTTDDYGHLAEAAYDPVRNPLTVWERFTLMRMALEGEGIADRVALLIAPRHDLDWQSVAQIYPPKRLICLTAKDKFEAAKETVWRSRGEQVHVFADLAAADVLTTTAIKAKVAAGTPWATFIPPSCHSFFAEIDGPRRVFAAARGHVPPDVVT